MAFDIVKVNPFNQVLDSDPKMASMLFSGTSTKNQGLTIENIKLHQQQVSQNQNFAPKVNKLLQMAKNFNANEAKTVTDFHQDFPIFDALVELEEDTKNLDKMKDHFMDSVLDFSNIEQQFSKIHLLIDNLFQNEDDLKP